MGRLCVEEEFVVFMHDLADSAEVTRRVESIGEYGIHDLSMLEDGSVGMVVRVEKDAAMLMMQSSTPDRPDVRATRLHDMRRKAGGGRSRRLHPFTRVFWCST